MKNIDTIVLTENNREESLPGFDTDFPYIATRAELDKYTVPWHWHSSVELFYIESGKLEYTTPNGSVIFPAGSGGFVNSNVLHMSKVCPAADATVQLLHLFDPVLLSGGIGSRVDALYILPVTASSLEILPFYPENPAHTRILNSILQAFQIDKEQYGYEFLLRERLTEIWLQILVLAKSQTTRQRHTSVDSLLKTLMAYVHEHYPESISVRQLAQAGNISKRTCFRLFQENLHMSPLEYIRSYRLQKTCYLLTHTELPITQIAYTCGLGSSSYFSKTFRDAFGCTPMEYRKMARS